MTPALELLFAYSLALFLFSLIGGVLPQLINMTHTRTQLALSLVSGLMLGVAFFHLLPHAVYALDAPDGVNIAMGWAVFGLVVMLMLLRLLHFQHPGYASEASGPCDHHNHGGVLPSHDGHDHAVGDGAAPASWKGVLIGLTLHTFIDGVALGAAVLAAPGGLDEQVLGFGVFIAILLHKPLDAISITALMQAAGMSVKARTRANVLFAIVCPLGAVFFYFLGQNAQAFGVPLVAAALAFSSGAFICIALSDLLPEVQFHSHDRAKLTIVFLLGIGLSLLMARAAHDHDHRQLSQVPQAAERALSASACVAVMSEATPRCSQGWRRSQTSV